MKDYIYFKVKSNCIAWRHSGTPDRELRRGELYKIEEKVWNAFPNVGWKEATYVPTNFDLMLETKGNLDSVIELE